MRSATRDDLLDLLEMGREFADAAGRDLDRETLVNTFEQMMDADDGFLLITEGGMLGGVVYPSFMDTNTKIAQELFWWVEPRARQNGIGDAMMTAFERWAIEQGAAQVIMVALHKLTPRKIGKIYKARGYEPLEHGYVKGI